MEILNDHTIRLVAMSIAQFLLLSKKLSLDKCLELFKKPNAENYLRKLIDGRSNFLDTVPRSIGIDLSSEIIASKIQQSLDVKHIKKVEIIQEQLDRIKPKFKSDLLYSHPTKIWIRFYSKETNIEQITSLFNYSIFKVCPCIYELYCCKKKTNIKYLLQYLETQYQANLIFCSELPMFLDDPLLFLSNYIKFMWCYTLNRNIFDPSSCTDIRTLLIYTTYGMLFMNTNNLSNMPKNTHGPLIACSGERPKVALSKFDPSTTYINEGSRAMQTLNLSSDFGTVSNFIEYIAEVDIKNQSLNNII